MNFATKIKILFWIMRTTYIINQLQISQIKITVQESDLVAKSSEFIYIQRMKSEFFGKIYRILMKPH